MDGFKSPEEAAHHFAAAFQQAAACVSRERFVYPRAQPLDETRALIFNGGGDIRLHDGIYLYVAHHYTVSEQEPGSFAVRTNGYAYSIDSEELAGELASWQWHPQSPSWCTWPHLHARCEHGDHMPTGRVAFEQVLRWLIEELDVPSLRSDWEDVLLQNETDWRSRRSWA